MMTISTMEPPALWDAEMIRDHKVEVLKAVRALDPDVDAVRGQYTAGLVDGDAGHRVPSRARRRSRRRAPTPSPRCGCHLDTWRWEGVPVLMRSGKRLGGEGARGRVPVQGAADPLVPAHAARARRTQLVGVPHEPDRVHRSRRADEAARPRARSARVGAAARRVQRRGRVDHEASAYESLLLEVLEGDHTPFLRFDEVEWSWRIVDPVLKAWEAGAPEDYVAGQRRPDRPAPLPRLRPLVAAARPARSLTATARRAVCTRPT